MISLEDFNANFSTTICRFSREQDQSCCTGFKVKSLTSNKIFYMQTCVADSAPDATESDIVNTGWTQVLPHIKTWATEVVNGTNSAFVPPAPFDTEKFDVRVDRYDTYPEKTPYCWCVGFTCVSKSNPTLVKYIDTQVSVNMEEYTPEQQIVSTAWDNVKAQYESWATEALNTSALLNTSFTSSNW